MIKYKINCNYTMKGRTMKGRTMKGLTMKGRTIRLTKRKKGGSNCGCGNNVKKPIKR
jgi:hypothetical protein